MGVPAAARWRSPGGIAWASGRVAERAPRTRPARSVRLPARATGAARQRPERWRRRGTDRLSLELLEELLVEVHLRDLVAGHAGLADVDQGVDVERDLDGLVDEHRHHPGQDLGARRRLRLAAQVLVRELRVGGVLPALDVREL